MAGTSGGFALTKDLPRELRKQIWAWFMGIGAPPAAWLYSLDYDQIEALARWAAPRHWMESKVGTAYTRSTTDPMALRWLESRSTYLREAAAKGMYTAAKGMYTGYEILLPKESTPVNTDQIIKQLGSMAYGSLRNYIVPGLTSQLIGEGPKGKVRIFTSDRDQKNHILPHSHRFDFTCLVLKGQVINSVYTPASYGQTDGVDLHAVGTLTLADGGKPGECVMTPGTQGLPFAAALRAYREGDTYAMTAKEIHSIEFKKDSVVLFLEGPRLTDTSVVLEPWSNGQRVATYGVQPWMFQKED